MLKKRAVLALLAGLAGVACLAPGPVPPPWVDADINSPGMAGSATYDPATTVWAVSGGGGDIWNAADQMNFVYMPVSGDCTLTARVTAQANTNVWAKAGVMIRETPAAGSTFAMAAITPGNGAIVQWRTSTNGSAAWPGSGAAGTVPMWVRITRSGTTFTGYYSTNGTTWTANGNVTIAMAATVQVGLAVTAHDNTLLCACTFDNFTVVDGTGAYYWPLQPPGNLQSTAGPNQVSLTWNFSAGATSYNVYQGSAPGGPYNPIATGVSATAYVDTTAAFPNTYYYVVTAVETGVGASVYSNQTTCAPLQPAVTVTPLGPITTSESGTTATLTLTVNQVPSGTASITLNSSNPSQALLSQGGAPTNPLSIPMTGATAGQTFSVTVVGVDDFIAGNGNQPYTISFTVNSGWTGLNIPSINGTNLEADVAALVVNPSGGLMTDTNGGQASFTVQLNSLPASGLVTVTVASSNTTEGTVNATTLNFTGSTWNAPQTVTITGQGVNLSYLNTPYTINLSASGDTAYNGIASSVSVVNIHLEVPPALSHVWGGGSGGGCGLLGLEVVLALALSAIHRHRGLLSARPRSGHRGFDP
jgi:fibronectin type 3 domain-containing protein